MKQLIIVLLLAFTLAGCTENVRARNYGGNSTVDLPAGQKLVNIAWKNANMWYLTRPMRADESPEQYKFKESSSWGVAEGTIIVKESRK